MLQKVKTTDFGEPCHKIKVSENATAVATQIGEKRIALWDIAASKQQCTISTPHHIRDFALSSNLPEIVIVTGADQPDRHMAATTTVQIFDLETGRLSFEHSSLDIRSVSFLDKDQHIALGRLNRLPSQNHFIDIYDAQFLTIVNSLEIPKPNLPFALNYLPQFSFLCCLGIGLDIWDLRTNQRIQQLNCETITTEWDIWETCCFAISAAHQIVALGFDRFRNRQRGPNIAVIDMSTWRVIGWFGEGEDEWPTSVDISPDGRFLAATTANKPVAQVWNIQTGELFGTCTAERMKTAVFLANNQLLIGAGSVVSRNVCNCAPHSTNFFNQQHS